MKDSALADENFSAVFLGHAGVEGYMEGMDCADDTRPAF